MLVSTITTKTAITSAFKPHGGYGVTVNTGACGALNQGSIPCSRPRQPKPDTKVLGFAAAWSGYRESKGGDSYEFRSEAEKERVEPGS